MTLNKTQIQRPACKHWFAFITIVLLLIALSGLIVYGFRISERPSLLNYPLISVVREIREEATRLHKHVQRVVQHPIPPASSLPWEGLDQAVWHLDIMLAKPASKNVKARQGDANQVYQQRLKTLKSCLKTYQAAIKEQLGYRGAHFGEPKSNATARAYEQLMDEVDAIEVAMIGTLNQSRRQFRQTIIGMTVFSLMMVVIAGRFFWKFEKQQIRIQAMLQDANDELEAQVQNRTRMISRANDQLRLEIKEHEKTEKRLLAYQKELRRVTSELLQTQERERRRIATDIHDRIGQALAVAKIQLGALQSSLAGPSQIAPVKEIRRLISRTIKDTRTLTFELSPPVLYELGLQAALEWLAESIQGQSGLSVCIEGNQADERLDTGRRVFLFQAVREVLFNAVKHARASTVDIRVSNRSDHAHIEVVDDGCGCDSSPTAYPKDQQDPGFGLFSIREQLRYYGGELIFDSEPEKGTRVTIMLPLETAA